MNREYKERLHYEALFFDRLNTAYLLNQNIKKKLKPTALYPLPMDKKEDKVISVERLNEIINKKDAVISNGKLRGYRDRENNLWDKTQSHIIGFYKDNLLEYIN